MVSKKIGLLVVTAEEKGVSSRGTTVHTWARAVRTSGGQIRSNLQVQPIPFLTNPDVPSPSLREALATPLGGLLLRHYLEEPAYLLLHLGLGLSNGLRLRTVSVPSGARVSAWATDFALGRRCSEWIHL